MNDKPWPNADELFRFVDEDLSPEQLERLNRHLERCSTCTREVAELRELLGDIRAPVGPGSLDVAEHVALVMARLDEPVSVAHVSRWPVFCGAVAAAAMLLVALSGALKSNTPSGEFQARGARSEASLARDVGVTLYAHEGSLRALRSGDRVQADTPLTAGLRHVGTAPAYLLLFAVDAKNTVHWIAPAFTAAGTDPEAPVVAPSPALRLLPTAAVFDDLSPGPLRVVAIVSPEPRHVSEVEALAESELDEAALRKRFPRADIRQFQLEIAPKVEP